MRILKFRAWHMTLKEMHFCDWMGHLDAFWNHIMTDPDAYKIMQYTGLKDKYGVEIYEGDIIKFRTDDDGDDEIQEVRFQDGAFIIEADFGEYDSTTLGWGIEMIKNSCHEDYQIEVIGNIYSNPELLNQGGRT